MVSILSYKIEWLLGYADELRDERRREAIKSSGEAQSKKESDLSKVIAACDELMDLTVKYQREHGE